MDSHATFRGLTGKAVGRSMVAAAGVMLLSGVTAWGQLAPEKEAPKTAGGSPKIVIEAPSYEFGEVWAGAKIEHEWVVRNEGTTILKIDGVKPSCGCTVAKNYDREILPGETGKIPVSIDTKRLSAKVTKSVTVTSNDPESPTLRLSIGGTVKQRMEVDPAKGGTFGRIKPNETVKRTLTLSNNTDIPMELTLTSAKAGVFQAELTVTEPGQKYELKLETNGPYAEGYNRGTISIKTSSPEEPTMEVPVSVYVLPEVEVTPAIVVIPKADPTSRSQPVRVTFNSDSSYKIVSAETDNKDIAVTVNETRPNMFMVTLQLPENYMPPLTGHTLTIKTDHPEKSTVTVPINQSRSNAPPQAQPATALLGKTIPSVTFDEFDGGTFSTTETELPTFYFFYASWCGYCKKALPTLNEWAKDMDGKGIRFVGVSMDTIVEEASPNKGRAKTKEEVSQQWKDLGIVFTQALDKNAAGSQQFNVRGFPTLFLADKDKKIQRVYSGIGAVTSGELKTDMTALIEGKALAAQNVPVAATPAPNPTLELAGKPVPAATFVTAQGESRDLKDSGKVTLAMFYASWCGFCKKALPILETINKELNGDVDILAVSMDSLVEHGADPKDRRAKTKEFVVKQFEEFGLSYAQAFDPEGAGNKQFGVRSYPTMFLIDKDSKISKVYIGGQAAMDGSLKKDIEALVKKDRADAGGAPPTVHANAKPTSE